MNNIVPSLQIVKEVILPHGMEIDISQAWTKLISAQFGGEPGRGFSELIQNLLDSYPSSLPWNERRGDIVTGTGKISLTDYGEGLNRNRLRLLATLGGTDKHGDSTKIGTFGVGFFSIFNPALSTEQVVVTTRCEGHVVEMKFIVKSPGERPHISTRILDVNIPYSTRIQITFLDENSPQRCLDYAQKCLLYYPCRIRINGQKFPNVWEHGKESRSSHFISGPVEGLIGRSKSLARAIVLCKYEQVLDYSIAGVVTGGHNMTYDLRDYARRMMPILPMRYLIINSNQLNVTISRDSVMMDRAYDEMIEIMRAAMLRELNGILAVPDVSPEIVVANHFTLAEYLRDHLSGKKRPNGPWHDEGTEALEKLATIPVYTLKDKMGKYSLKTIMKMKSSNVPLFFSPLQSNLRWLGGGFLHDFIVLPPKCHFHNGAPSMYDRIFNVLFVDTVNLDTIAKDEKRIAELVNAKIVPKELLEQKVEILEQRGLSREEALLAEELGRIFALKEMKAVVSEELRRPIDTIQVAFFQFIDQGALIATGLFDGEGRLLSETAEASSEQERNEAKTTRAPEDTAVLIGLNRNNQLIRSLLETANEDRAYFLVPILAGELVRNQKSLVPHTAVFHEIKEKLAIKLRNVLLDQLWNEAKAA